VDGRTSVTREEVTHVCATSSEETEDHTIPVVRYDKYGLSWQIIPRQLGELLSDSNRKKGLAATNAMLQMKKIVIADLQKAFDEA